MSPENDIKIINLSKRNLLQSEQQILTKGLKFTPIPTRTNYEELKVDMSEFTRKLRLAELFDGMEDPDKSLRKNRSSFVPPKKSEFSA